MSDLVPGTLVAITTGALVRRYGSESEHYTTGIQLGMIIQRSHQWREPSDEHVFREAADPMGIGEFASFRSGSLNPLTEAVPPGTEGCIYPDYLVLFSNDNRMYLVPQDHIRHPDHAGDAGRLFGRLTG